MARRIAPKNSVASLRSSASENFPKSRVEKVSWKVVVSRSARRRKLMAPPLSAASSIMLRCSTTTVRLRGAARVTKRRVESTHARASRARRVTVAALSPCDAAIAMIPSGAHVDRERAALEAVARDLPRLLAAKRGGSEEPRNAITRQQAHQRSDYGFTAFRSATRAARA